MTPQRQNWEAASQRVISAKGSRRQHVPNEQSAGCIPVVELFARALDSDALICFEGRRADGVRSEGAKRLATYWTSVSYLVRAIKAAALPSDVHLYFDRSVHATLPITNHPTSPSRRSRWRMQASRNALLKSRHDRLCQKSSY